MSDLNINSHYNFSVYAPAVLGTQFNNAQLLCRLNYKTAMKYGNIELTQKQVAGYLPPGTPLDHTKYEYLLFNINGKEVPYATAWIDANSIEETSGANYTIRLNNITPQQHATVRDQLRLLGISFDLI